MNQVISLSPEAKEALDKLTAAFNRLAIAVETANAQSAAKPKG